MRDELSEMQADRYLFREAQTPPYGPRFAVTSHGEELEGRFSRTMGRYGDQIDRIAEHLGAKGVASLERLATGLWVTNHADEGVSAEDRAVQLQSIKRHVAYDDAVNAIEEIDEMIAKLH